MDSTQMSPFERRSRYCARWTELKSMRSGQGWDQTWRELAAYIRPRRSRFFTTERLSSGTSKEWAIVNAAATRALKVQSAGMLAGVTSPARPWLRITTEDPDLADLDSVKDWLDLLSRRTLSVLARTNIYNAFHATYEGLGTFATHCFLWEDDLQTVLRAYTQPIGEFCLAVDGRGEVDTLFRTRAFTVRQMVERFKLKKCSARVQELYSTGKYDVPIDVLHVVEPRLSYDPSKADNTNMPWASCWLEMDAADDKNVGILKESGYRECPIMAPRWDVLDEDVYGTGPGNEAIGDTKGLQLYERKKAQAVERMVDPPLRASNALNNLPINLKPGGITFGAGVGGQAPAVEPLLTINPAAVTVANESIGAITQRIREAFGADLWLMMSDAGDPQKTAREVAERHEEKLLQLGPVMERLESELLNKVVTRTISVLLQRKLLPPPPRELQGQQVKLEYMSVMAQAQRMVKGTAVQQFTGFVQALAAVQPSVLDKVNTDELVTEMADALGLGAKVLNPSDQVQQVRQQRAQAEAQKAAAESMLAHAQAGKALGDTSMEGDTALSRLVGGIPAAEAQGGA